jgi:hypothetical protein
MAPIAIRRRRPFFLTLILIAILGYAGLSIWSFKLQEDGVPRGSWSARSMPAMLNAFPVFETCGPVMQRLEGRDGERAQANFVSYASSLSAEALLGRYRTALASLGCTVSPGDAALSLSLACPGQAVSGFDIEVTDGPSCRSVEAFWWGGED